MNGQSRYVLAQAHVAKADSIVVPNRCTVGDETACGDLEKIKAINWASPEWDRYWWKHLVMLSNIPAATLKAKSKKEVT